MEKEDIKFRINLLTEALLTASIETDALFIRVVTARIKELEKMLQEMNKNYGKESN